MKKKFPIALLALACGLSCAFALSACGDNNEDTPGATISRETRSRVCKDIGDTMIDAAFSAANASSIMTASSDLSSGSALTEDEIYTDENADMRQWVMLASSYIYMTAEFYSNDQFVISDKTVALSGSIVSGGTTIETQLYIASFMDESTGEVDIDIDFTSLANYSPSQTQTQHSYVKVTADYDFEAQAAESITIKILTDVGSSPYIISARYAEGVIAGVDPDNAQAVAQVSEDTTSLKNAFEQTFEDKIQLGDFSQEISDANDYLTQKIEQAQTVEVQSITLDKTTLTISVGDEETLTATVTPANATNGTVTWSVSPSGIAEVENGRVTAIAEGTATVTAAAGGESATCTVTVEAVDNEVTQAEWDAAAKTEINKVTISSMQSGFPMPIITKYDKDGKKLYTEFLEGSSDGTSISYSKHITIAAKVGESYYVFNKSGERNWTRETISASEFDSQMTMASSSDAIVSGLEGKYADFTYSDGVYSAQNITIPSVGVANEMEITFENGAIKNIDIYINNAQMEMDITYQPGIADIQIPEGYDSVYYGIFTGENGWDIYYDTKIVFREDLTCNIENTEFTYTIENGVYIIDMTSVPNGQMYYVTVQGNILWLFLSLEDTTDTSNAVQFFYAGQEISDADRAIITQKFGDGIVGNNA